MSQQQFRDISPDLADRMATLEKEINRFREERTGIDVKLREMERKLAAMRLVWEFEEEQFNRPPSPLFAGKDRPSRFAGLRLKDALLLLRQEAPSLTKQEARQILIKEEFDFHGKNPGLAVHMAWVGIERQSRATQP